MDKVSLKLPVMYADHHVTEVRRILSQIDGVQDVYASSAFQTVDVRFDPAQVSEDQIQAALGEAGYLGDLPATVEPASAAAKGSANKDHFRHSIAYEQTKQVVSFNQKVNFEGRPLWPCPGMGPIKNMDEE